MFLKHRTNHQNRKQMNSSIRLGILSINQIASTKPNKTVQQLCIDINENNSKKSSLKNTLINFDQKHVKYIKTTIHTEMKLTFLDLFYVKIFGEVGFNDVNRAMLEVDGLVFNSFSNKVALKSSVLNFLCIFFSYLAAASVDFLDNSWPSRRNDCIYEESQAKTAIGSLSVSLV